MQLVCVRMHTLVCCLAGGGTKVAIVIAFLENSGLAGNSCCFRLARAGVQVLKVAAGPVILTRNSSRCCAAKVVFCFFAFRFPPVQSYVTATLIMATGSTSNEALPAAIQGLEDRMNERMTSMKELTQEREQVDERLVKCMKL